ncbi:hypothetical protein C8J56DRAFT_919356 [Mycena floridula]|nr:hypothetical protein C8J56DRAFT_919356 [Mycena floridula]
MSASEQNKSRSPSSKRSLISTLGDKLTRAMSADRQTPQRVESDNISVVSVTSNTSTVVANGPERSVSRGREGFHSSGRGGAGNFVRSSVSPDLNGQSASTFHPSPTRGNEPQPVPSKVFGRGGAGNVRSDALTSADTVREMEYSPSTSRSRSRGTPIYSTGRGGAGNMKVSGLENVEEDGSNLPIERGRAPVKSVPLPEPSNDNPPSYEEDQAVRH